MYIICELGSNYRNDNDLINAVHLAKAAGADAIKFQVFNESELYGPFESVAYFPWGPVRAACDIHKIDMIVSTFSPQGFAEADKWVDKHKIASCEMSHVRMLEKAKLSTKPTVLSTGGWGIPDIRRILETEMLNPWALMHCNVSYPAKYSDLAKFRTIKGMFSGQVGYSDHTISIDAVPLLFQELGATVLEKHFNPYDLTNTPDAPHSLGQKEFKIMVQCLRGEHPSYTEENPARDKYLRRLIATRDLKPGDELKENVNFGIFRARDSQPQALTPFAVAAVNGRAVNREIKAGQGIWIDAIE